MKRIVLCCLLCALLVPLSGFGLRTGGREENRTTDTRSDSFADQAEKLAFFESYVVCPTPVLDADYHILLHDNSTGLVPGPSDWRISAVIRVDPADIPAWTEDMVEAANDDIDFTWWEGLGSLADAVTGETPSALYRRTESNSFLAVYREAGIILKYFATY